MYVNFRIQTVIGVQIAIIALALMIGSAVAHLRSESLVDKLLLRADATDEKIMTLALLTDNNGADAEVSALISDCSRRQEFEDYLNRLEKLNKKELLMLQSLFDSCGQFYTERKSLMVSKLDREFLAYKEWSELLMQVGSSVLSTRELQWGKVVEHEKTRSSLLSEQNKIQQAVISALLSGSSVQSKEIQSLLQQAFDVRELLEVNDVQVDQVRQALSE